MLSASQLSSELDALMRDWSLRRQSNEPFISDGAVDPEQWVESPEPRILFFLKEAYSAEDFSLCEYVYNTDRWQTWHDVAVITCAIQDAFSGYVRYSHRRIIEDNRKHLHRSIAVINAKKFGGDVVSDMDSVWFQAKRDSDLIRKEFEILRPDVIVTGGTFDVLADIFPDLKDPLNKLGDTGDVVFKMGRTLVLDFHHPAARSTFSHDYYAIAGMCMAAIEDRFI